MIEKRPSRWRSLFRKDERRDTSGGNDPVSNLGWPTAAPEPTAEHRRLGWVDAPAAVSRETVEEGGAEGSEAAEGQAPHAPESASTTAESVPTESRPAESESLQSTSLGPDPGAQERGDSGAAEGAAGSPGGEPLGGGAATAEGSTAEGSTCGRAVEVGRIRRGASEWTPFRGTVPGRACDRGEHLLHVVGG